MLTDPVHCYRSGAIKAILLFTSLMDQEKTIGAHPIQAVETEGNQVSNLDNDAAEIQSTNEVSYPTGVKLATITIAVALSVLLVALVSTRIWC